MVNALPTTETLTVATGLLQNSDESLSFPHFPILKKMKVSEILEGDRAIFQG